MIKIGVILGLFFGFVIGVLFTIGVRRWKKDMEEIIVPGALIGPVINYKPILEYKPTCK